MKLIQRMALRWLRWRYGGDVAALKPPIGYHPVYSPKTLWWIACYRIRWTLWRVEKAVFDKYGEPMRDAWDESWVASKNWPRPRGGVPDR